MFQVLSAHIQVHALIRDKTAAQMYPFEPQRCSMYYFPLTIIKLYMMGIQVLKVQATISRDKFF